MTEVFQVMPPLTVDQVTALREDIEKHGIIVPVIVDQNGRVIDGHNRVEIAQRLGIECPTEVRQVADDDEARDLAVTLNCARRHLTREQVRAVITAEAARRPDDSDRAIARRVGCSPSTVGAVRRGRVSNLDTDEDDVPSEAEIAEKLAAIAQQRYQEAEESGIDRDAWGLAVQVCDDILDWGEGELPNTFWFLVVAPTVYEKCDSLDVWELLSIWLFHVAQLVILESDDVREDRGAPDWVGPGEELARLTTAIWNPEVDIHTRARVFRAMDVPVAIAVVNAQREFGGEPARRSAANRGGGLR